MSPIHTPEAYVGLTDDDDDNDSNGFDEITPQDIANMGNEPSESRAPSPPPPPTPTFGRNLAEQLTPLLLPATSPAVQRLERAADAMNTTLRSPAPATIGGSVFTSDNKPPSRPSSRLSDVQPLPDAPRGILRTGSSNATAPLVTPGRDAKARASAAPKPLNRAILLRQIKAYMKYFDDKCKDCIPPNYLGLSNAQLQDVVIACDAALSEGHEYEILSFGVVASMQAFETWVVPRLSEESMFRHCGGITQTTAVVLEDHATPNPVQRALRRIAILYTGKADIGAWGGLAAAMGQYTYTYAMQNRARGSSTYDDDDDDRELPDDGDQPT